MGSVSQVRTLKCPHCGWQTDLTVPGAEMDVEVVASALSDAWRGVLTRVRDLASDPELDEANAWLDIERCPNPECGKPYQYNVRTGKTRP